MKKSSIFAMALTASLITPAIVVPMATPVEAAITKFKDVPSSHWAYNAITQVAQKGLVTGYTDGTYKPSEQVTRAEFATFLSRIFEGEKRVAANFKDVPSTHWANDAIQEGLAVGFIQSSDFSNNKFEPNKAMTRGEMSRWLANGLAHVNADYGKAIEEMATSSRTLIPIPEFYKGGVNKSDLPYIGIALGTGLLSGYEDFTFKPSGNTTRAEVATILIRFMDVIKKAPTDFTGLQELLEVAKTGTNILTLTDYEQSPLKFGGYEDVLGKQHTYMNDTGVATIEHAIFVDITGKTAKGIYKDMFFNESAESISLNRNGYRIYYEYTFVPSRDVSFHSVSNGSDMHYASNELVNKAKIEQFNIPSPKSYSKNDFLKNGKYRFWGANGVLNGEIISGSADDKSRFYYVNPRTKE